MRALALAVCLALCSCAGKSSLYAWGEYEEAVYHLTREDMDGLEIGTEIERMQSEFQKAEDNEYLVPPGFLVHLGYLLLRTGDVAGARANFELEKSRFPQSAAFVDWLVSRMEPRP